MASGLDFPTFYDRFEHLRRRMRRNLGWRTVIVLALSSLLGFVMVAGLDYRFEMPWRARALLLGTVTVLAASIAVRLVALGIRNGTRIRTASAIESKFPELGQRVRTTVSYRGRSPEQLKAAGVAPGLVRALETEAAVSTLPLQLEGLVPNRRLIATTSIAAGLLSVVAIASILHSEWRTAFRRAMLAKDSFTQLIVDGGDVIVNRGGEVTLTAATQGRIRENVTLRTRPINPIHLVSVATSLENDRSPKIVPPTGEEPSWNIGTFSVSDAEPTSEGGLVYTATFSNVSDAFEFQWLAGPEASPIHRVDVRSPLQIKTIAIEVTPPAYTGLPRTVSNSGNFDAPEGSHAVIAIELDGVPESARLVMTPTTMLPIDNNEPEVIEAHIEGQVLRFKTKMTADFNWRIEATSVQGMPVSETSYRVRVRKDAAPAVSFEEPSAPLDVHSLAEILMRIRVRDDFGLSRAGIVFQINNEEEHTLISEDFQQVADELASIGSTPPKTNATLERTLPLEHFKLIEKDAITFYGFAEDNRPGSSQRTETELGFIDIRPFKTIYRVQSQSEGEGGASEGPRRATFEELIGRQRMALNQTVALKRSPKQDLMGTDRLMKFEGQIAELTNGLAQFLRSQAEQFNIPALFDNADLLFQAERAMLDSVDSMSVGKFDVAILQEKDAIRFLVESRDRLEIVLQNANDPAGLERSIGNYFRQQQTKLRDKNRTFKDEQEKTQDLLVRLAQLSAQQSMIADELTSMETDITRALQEGGDASDDSVSTTDTNLASKRNPTPTTEPDDVDSEGATRSADSQRRQSGAMTREEILQRQRDIAGDAADIQGELEKMQKATDLVRRRMTAVAESAAAAADALSRGGTRAAVKSANVAADKLELLMSLAEGLLAPDLADQLEVARDMADDISRQEQNLAVTTESVSNVRRPLPPGSIEPNRDDAKQREALARSAEQLAQQGESLADLLNSAAKSPRTLDQKSILQIADLLDAGGVMDAIEKMNRQAAEIRTGKLTDEATTAAELSARFDEIARQLDSLQREIVNPQVAELMRLEATAEKLAEGLEDVQTKRQSEQWLSAADRFLEELDDSGAGIESQNELEDQMKADGWDETFKRLRGPADLGSHAASYQRSIRKIADDLRREVQRLLLAELTTTGEEIPPAQYEGFVSKYERALTAGPRSIESRASKIRERRVKGRGKE